MDYQYIQCHGQISKPCWMNTARDKNRIHMVSFIKSIRKPKRVLLWQKISHWLPESGGGRKLVRTAANLGANSNILSLSCCHVGVDICQKLTSCSSDVCLCYMNYISGKLIRKSPYPDSGLAILRSSFGWSGGVLVVPVFKSRAVQRDL